MTILVGLVLTILTFVIIIYPLFTRRSSSKGLNGVLLKEHYRDMKKRYKTKALPTLKEIEGFGKTTDLDAEIEKQILKLRRYEGQVCPRCGARCRDDDRFCSGCGTKLNKGEHSD